MNRPSDWQQRERGLDLGHSCIVQAPAGSGKTELLTQRMLGLLARVEHPEEVVAITFTRKAAAQMGSRLLQHLQAAQNQIQGTGPGETIQPHEQTSRELASAALENDARRGWNLLEQPSRLRIRTIDSLCSELARQLPILSGLGGGQQVVDNASALYREAATRTMAAIEKEDEDLHADVSRLLGRYDNQYDRLTGLLTSMLANREQWIGHLLNARKGNGFDRDGLEYALRFLVEVQLEQACLLTPPELLAALPRLYRYALGNQPKNGDALETLLETRSDPASDMLQLDGDADSLDDWKTVIDTLLIKAGTMRKEPGVHEGFPAPSNAKGEERERRRAMKGEFKDLLAEHAGNTALLEVFNTIRTLPSPSFDDEAWGSLESLMRILLQAAQNLKLVMAETGEADFSEISHRAIEALGYEDAPSELALRMDYRIQHLLVDEFQDTSYSQVKLLKLLTGGWSDGDGRTLFLVGDPMQSIYRFRKAEVSLFIKAWQGELFEHIQLVPLRLSVNFRSTSPVVGWVNDVFPSVMPARNDPVVGAVSYSSASTRPGVSQQGEVALKIFAQRDEEREAQEIIDIIRRCSPEESLAILVRSRSHASAILSALDKLKVEQPRFRYQAIKFTRLGDTTLVRDLVSLTLALTQPADRLAWLSVLRAPFVGLDLADLDHLVGGDSNGIILDAIDAKNDLFTTLSGAGRRRLNRVAPILLAACNRRSRQSVRSLVETCWTALGGPACVNNSSELDDAGTYFDLLDSMEAEDLPIDRDTLDLRMQDLYAEPDADADGSLQVLTIHTAKGLQFDTVILPGLNRRSGRDTGKLLHWFELPGEDHIVMSPMRNNSDREDQSGDLIQFISGIEKQHGEFESGRLLYVAATRAIRKLYLFAAIEPTSKGEIKATSSTLLANLWPAVREQQEPEVMQDGHELAAVDETLSITDQADPSAGTAIAQIYRRLDADWRLPDPPAAVEIPAALPGETPGHIAFDWAGEEARLTGNLVHRLLQVISEQGLENWKGRDDLSVQLDWCRQQLASLGLRGEKAKAIIEDTTHAIKTTLASERGRWILARHEDAHCEHRLTVVRHGGSTRKQTRGLVLDRTFVSDGVRWIIDYKTSSHRGGDLEGFLENEVKRYREQLQSYSDALALTETRPIKTALYFPLLDHFEVVS